MNLWEQEETLELYIWLCYPLNEISIAQVPLFWQILTNKENHRCEEINNLGKTLNEIALTSVALS